MVQNVPQYGHFTLIVPEFNSPFLQGSAVLQDRQCKSFLILETSLTRKPCCERNVNKMKNVFSNVEGILLPCFRLTVL
jgi:hypothetical protein